MTILMTGAAGNVGRHIKTAFDGHTIISVDKAADPGDPNAYAIDLATDGDKLADIFATHRPDTVIHLAAILGGVCEANPHLAQRINVDATKQLAEFAAQHKAKRFVFFSTSAVYNQHELAPTDEHSNIDPQSVYGATKLAAEAEIQKVAEAHPATTFVTLRPFNIYGQGFSRSLVQMLLASTPEDPISLTSMETFYRDYIHISDVVKAVQLAQSHDFAAPHTIFNVGSGTAISTAQLVETLQKAGATLHYKQADAGPGARSISWADISLAKSLGFAPHTEIIVDRD